MRLGNLSWLLVSLALLFATLATQAIAEQVVLESYWARSASGGPIYPGSTAATLTVNARYHGTKVLPSLTACVEPPPELQFRNKCDVAVNLDPGDVAEFNFVFDVKRDAQPGPYELVVSFNTGESVINYTIVVDVEPYPKPNLIVVDSWLEPYDYTPAGSARIVVIVENLGDVDVVEGYGEATFPKGFLPLKLKFNVGGIASGDRGKIVLDSVTITLPPGIYAISLDLRLKMRTSDGVNFWAETALEAYVALNASPSDTLRIVNSYWLYGGYENSTSSVLRLILANYGHCVVERLLILIDPKDSPLIPHTPLLVTETIAPMELSSIDLEVDIDGSAGNYSVSLSIIAQQNCGGLRTISRTESVIMVEVKSANVVVELVDAGLTRGYGLSEAESTSIYIILRNRAPQTLIHVSAELLLLNAISGDGDNKVYAEVQRATAYGSTTSLIFNGIRTSVTSIEAVLKAILVYDDNGVRYLVLVEKKLVIKWKPLKPLFLAEVYSEYNGQPAPLLPGQKGVELVITLVNTLPDPISSLHAINYSFPEGIRVWRIAGSCLAGVAAGSSCSIRLWLEINDDVAPGDYNVTLRLTGFTSGDVWKFLDTLMFKISIAPVKDYAPILRVIGVFWGSPTSPEIAYTGNPRQPLTVQILNVGRETASAVTVSLISDWASVLNRVGYCGSIPSGGLCQQVFYLNLANTDPDTYIINIIVNYTYTGYGVHVSFTEKKIVEVSVEKLSGQGVHVVDVNWMAKTYPGSKGATMIVNLANLNPQPLAAIEAWLEPPLGFNASATRSLYAFIEGPIQPFAVATISFQVDVSPTLRPGNYTFTIHIRYWVVQGGVYSEKVEEEKFGLLIEDPRTAVEPITVIWQGPSPGPGQRSARLILVFRILDETISSPVLHLRLPPGLIYAETNERIAKLTPYFPEARFPEDLESVLRMVEMSSQQQTRFLVYIAPVIVERNAAIGEHSVEATIDFIDAWGSRHNATYMLSVKVLGEPQPVIVESLPVARLANGTALLKLLITNNGSAPLYNLYAILIPETPIAYPTDPIAYISHVKPGETVPIDYVLVFNPYGYMGYTGYTFAARLAILYQDPKGYNYMLNTSIAAILAPPLKLEVHSLKAEYENGTLRVSMILVNLGVESVERVVIRLIDASGEIASSLIGDIEPSSEVPVRIEAFVPRKPGNVIVAIDYFDKYNNKYSSKYIVGVTEITPPSTKTYSAWQGLEALAIPFTALVVGVVSGLVFWRRRIRRAPPSTL